MVIHFGPDWSREIQKEGIGVRTPFLAIFSWIYGLGVRLRLAAYKGGLFKRKSLAGFVLSVGNLTVGGTGKTPAVSMIARWAFDQGHRVAVLSRGYSGRYETPVLLVSDGERVRADARQAGDEAHLLAKNLPGIPVIVSKKRYRAGMFAQEKFGCDFFVLDDGFQHLELKRDLDLALIDAARPLGNGHLLPWGPLREPLDQLSRANAFVLTRCDGNSEGKETLEFLGSRFPSCPVFFADHLPYSVVFPDSKETREPEFLKGKRILAFAGIGRPEVFKDTLIKLGANVICFEAFRDHYPFTMEDIQQLIRLKEREGAEYVLTTEKDWIRLTPLIKSCPGMGYLTIRFTILSHEGKFFSIIREAVTRKKGQA